MDNVCRVCLQEYDVLTPIFQNTDETVCLSLAEKISSIAQVQVRVVAFAFSDLPLVLRKHLRTVTCPLNYP